MGKIGIITFHRTTNFGSLLQTYGLYKKIELLGETPEIIDYRCDEIESREELNNQIKFTVRELAKRVLFYPTIKRKAEIKLFTQCGQLHPAYKFLIIESYLLPSRLDQALS